MKIISGIRKNNDRKVSLGKRAVRGLPVFLLAVSLFVYRDSFQEIWDGIFIALVCEFYRLTTLGNGSGVAEIHYLCNCGKKKNTNKSFGERDKGQKGQDSEGIAPGSATVLTMIQYIMKRTAIIGMGILGFLFLCRNGSTRELCREYAVFVGIAGLITAGIIIVFLALSLSDKVACGTCRALDFLSLKMPSKEDSFQKWKEQAGLLNQSGKSILKQKRRMLCAVFIQMGKLLLFYGIAAYFLKGKVSLGTGGCILLMALSFMLSGVIPAPSGAGALEFVFLLFFTRFADSGAAVTAILLFRFATWLCPAAVGGVFLAVQSVGGRRRHRVSGTGG